jgi:hypothetical protein
MPGRLVQRMEPPEAALKGERVVDGPVVSIAESNESARIAQFTHAPVIHERIARDH